MASADSMIEYIRRGALKIDRLLETHAHADHLPAAPYIQRTNGGNLRLALVSSRSKRPLAKSSMPGPNSPATVRNSTGSSLMATGS
jgi:glyoxylase-like metal-dependent hydrolase (beta-lactamase superfamily II)